LRPEILFSRFALLSSGPARRQRSARALPDNHNVEHQLNLARSNATYLHRSGMLRRCKMAASLLDPVIDALVGVKATGLEPKRLAEMLNMTQAEIADLAGVHRTTLTRNPRSPEVQAKLGPIATILSRASEMGGGRGRCRSGRRSRSYPALARRP
jgi:predicted DNA-binding protein (UPF0251 family)